MPSSSPDPGRRCLIVTLVSLCLLGFLISFAAAAPPREPSGRPSRRFDIPAGNAVDTLRLFSAQIGANERLLYAAEAIAGVRTNAIRGTFTSRSALEHMLERTVLICVQDPPSGTFVIRRKSDAAAAETRAAQPPPANPPSPMTTKTHGLWRWLLALPAAAVSAQSDPAKASDDTLVLAPFTIVEQSSKGYSSSTVTSATRTNTKLVDIPQTITVVGSSRVDLQACKLEYSIVSPK